MTGTFDFAAEPTGTDSICTQVICAIAEARGVDPLDLDPTLAEVIDPDALERLFRYDADDAHTGRVTFTMAGCEVVVRSNGHVTAHAVGVDRAPARHPGNRPRVVGEPDGGRSVDGLGSGG